ncbi:MAG TPA: hypothetical protein VGS12_16085, partial [Caulobacteraceae bacterium]|nr:hypothetical protein [Caulobacteraceae bacterium]
SPSPAGGGGSGEPLPASAPTNPYQLTAWCYGAMDEWVTIYDRVKPQLIRIDKTFGTTVKNEKEPYESDMAAARAELKVLAGAITAAEKASPQPIAEQGADEIRAGRSIWTPAESKSQRELADAWLTWGMPDKCDTVARQLAASSALLGQALKYNNPSALDAAAPAPASPEAAPPADATPDATPPPADAAPKPQL